MKVTLFDFQRDAIAKLREKIATTSSIASSEDPQAVVLSAPTGSGKTIIMTALFESILEQPDDQIASFSSDWEPKPDSIFLWISDIPELNEQAREKILTKSDRLNQPSRLICIDSSFDQPFLDPGNIYFINTQKLSIRQPLVNPGDGRQYSFWDTISRTIHKSAGNFFLVLDEAHRGMNNGSRSQEASTIIQRFIFGAKDLGLMRPPFLVGVSATPKRFLELLDNAPHAVHKIMIPPDAVRRSGLLKDRIVIHYKDQSLHGEIALLEAASRQWRTMQEEWSSFCVAEKETVVRPVFLIQVENGSEKRISKTDIQDVVAVIEKSIDRPIEPDEMVHAMNEIGDIEIFGKRVRKVDSSRIDGDKSIGIVLFKSSLSTGWDCPRAEVMMSFRRAEDATYIAQLLGRMVRTPLARRIEKSASLNDVHLFVPNFNEETVSRVVESLANTEQVPPSETGASGVLSVLLRREGIGDIFDASRALVTYRLNSVRSQSPLRRLVAIARNLTIDELDPAAWETAKDQIVHWMRNGIESLISSGEMVSLLNGIFTIQVDSLAVNGATGEKESRASYSLSASPVDIERLFDSSGRAYSHGLHMEYWHANQERDPLQVKAEVIALSRCGPQIALLEEAASQEFNRLYDHHKRSIYDLPESRRLEYERLRLATAVPTVIPWLLPDSIDHKRKSDAKSWDKHLYVDAQGQYASDLKGWEAALLKQELRNPATLGWLRNQDRKPWALQIPYQSGSEILPFYPDFIIARRGKTTIEFDILEPHRPDLSDNFEKAVGMARFAEKHGHLFGRIQLIRATTTSDEQKFARLEFNMESRIKEVLLLTSNPQLDALFEKLGG